MYFQLSNVSFTRQNQLYFKREDKAWEIKKRKRGKGISSAWTGIPHHCFSDSLNWNQRINLLYVPFIFLHNIFLIYIYIYYEHTYIQYIATLASGSSGTITCTQKNSIHCNGFTVLNHKKLDFCVISQMGMLQNNGLTEGWLYLIRSNRIGIKFARRRYFVFKDNCLRCYKGIPISERQVFLLFVFAICVFPFAFFFFFFNYYYYFFKWY